MWYGIQDSNEHDKDNLYMYGQGIITVICVKYLKTQLHSHFYYHSGIVLIQIAGGAQCGVQGCKEYRNECLHTER